MVLRSTARMECLPDDVVIEISEYLTAQELAALCATSRLWRDRLNMDIYWRWRCDADLAQYLRDTECVVEPGFVSPQLQDSGLSDVCEWRLNYMRLNHFHNNWRQGRHKDYCVDSVLQGATLGRSMIYKNDFVITFGYKNHGSNSSTAENKIEIWNVKRNPILESEYISFTEVERTLKYVNTNLHKVVLSEDFIVLIDRALVQVLAVSQSLNIQLKHAFHFTKSETLPGPLFHQAPTDGFDYANSRFCTVVKGSILLAILPKSPNHNKTMHVWNVQTGKKIKEEVYEDCVFVNIFHNRSIGKDKAMIHVREPNSVCKVVIYCVVKLEFKPFSLSNKQPVFSSLYKIYPSSSLIIIKDQFLALKSSQERIEVYNIETNEHVLKQHLVHWNSGIFAINNDLLFVDSCGLKAYNLKSKEIKTVLEDSNDINLSMVVLEKFILFHYNASDTARATPRICYVNKTNATVVRPFPHYYFDLFHRDHNRFFSKVLKCSPQDLTVSNFW